MSASKGGKAPRKHLAVKKDSGSGPSRKFCQHHLGIAVLKEIQKYQRSTELLIRFRPFCWLVKEIAENYGVGLRFQVSALKALKKHQKPS